MKKFVITCGILMLSSLSANAFVDTNYTTTKQYLLNSGYSGGMYEMAGLATRDPYAPTDDIYPERNFKNFMKILWKKVDPTAFPDNNGTWHDIKLNTGFYDL